MLNNMAVIFIFFCFTVSVKTYFTCVNQDLPSHLVVGHNVLWYLNHNIGDLWETTKGWGMLVHDLSVIQACMT